MCWMGVEASHIQYVLHRASPFAALEAFVGK
jgi:hypothetical protein